LLIDASPASSLTEQQGRNGRIGGIVEQKAERAAPAGARPRITLLGGTAAPDDAADVVVGLSSTPKWLPSRFFYDACGSTLFDRICDLPEYYPTRTEEGILERIAPDIAARTGATLVVELGSGSARKVRRLVGAYDAAGVPIRYVPIDVSAAAIEGAAADLLEEFPGLAVEGLVGTYERGLAQLAARPDADPMLVLFLGSTIGNFPPAGARRFLTALRRVLRPGDLFLIGIDLRKDVDVIEGAYNDSEGITACFNRNLLRHLNRAFDGDFLPDRFDHVAFYNRRAHRIEMHLRSRVGQTARLKALGVTASFAPGETVRTEISRKFDADAFGRLLARHGFAPVERWTDPRRWFGLILARAA
jgi:dimethylhistidine N-methyltransferase